MVEAYKKMWINAFNFSGRTSRSDFWYAILANFIIGLILGFFGEVGIMISAIYSLIILIPSIAMEIRRMHDSNKSGWYLFMSLIPLVGWIFVLIAYCASSVEPNKYGPLV